MIISLIGYRGTGKTTVAAALAGRLGWDWVDADDEIERRAGRSIREIFADAGEAEFRRIEREAMAELISRERLVLAAGGGAILHDRTRSEIPAAGPVVWLRASVDTIAERLCKDGTTSDRRPALTAAGGREEIERLAAERAPLYDECASVAMDTDGRTIDEVVSDILAVASVQAALAKGVRT